jgi:hypothetical protein
MRHAGTGGGGHSFPERAMSLRLTGIPIHAIIPQHEKLLKGGTYEQGK